MNCATTVPSTYFGFLSILFTHAVECPSAWPSLTHTSAWQNSCHYTDSHAKRWVSKMSLIRILAVLSLPL